MQKVRKIILLVLSSVFLLQTAGVISWIPFKPVLYLLGIGDNPISIFFSGMLSIVLIFLSTLIVEFFYSLGFSKSFVNKRVSLGHGVIGFITVWIAFFSYGIFVICGFFPKVVDTAQFVNYYLFWFFLFEAYNKVTKRAESSSFQSALDENRVTWFSHISGLNTVAEYSGDKGDLLYKKSASKFYLFFPIFIFILTFKILEITGLVAFGILPIKDANGVIDPQISFFVRAAFSFFFVAIIIPIIRFLGLGMSKGIALYQNCIVLDLPTFSDAPLFTSILPKSTVVIGLNEIQSHSYDVVRHHHKNGGETSETYLVIKTKDGDLLKSMLTMTDSASFEKIFNPVMQSKKVANSA